MEPRHPSRILLKPNGHWRSPRLNRFHSGEKRSNQKIWDAPLLSYLVDCSPRQADSPAFPVALRSDSAMVQPPSMSASHVLWSCGCGATSPPFEEVGPTVVLQGAFDGKQAVGLSLRPAAPARLKRCRRFACRRFPRRRNRSAVRASGRGRSAFDLCWFRRCGCRSRPLQAGDAASGRL